MTLETARLQLRALRQGDYAALCEILQDGETMTAYEGAFTDGEAQAWLEKQFQRYARDGFGLNAVILRETGELVGQCGLTLQPWRDQTLLEVGYLFNRRFWHCGYATEAAAACRDYAFTVLNAPAVHAIIRDTNRASRRVAERCGMRVTDAWIKHYRGVDMPHLLYTVRRDGVTG